MVDAGSNGGDRSGSLAVIIVLDRGRWLWELASAIRHQRDKARERLKEIKEASLKYTVVPTNADTAPRNEDALRRVLIENRGRGARFAVVIERISGTEEPLLDSLSPLYWMARKGVLDEEIPAGEGRLIGVGSISHGDNTYWFTPLSPEGRPYDRRYRLTEGVTTICLRVSVRGLPEISYTRWVNVSITWDGPGSEYFVDLGPDPDPPDKSETIPTMAALLDF